MKGLIILAAIFGLVDNSDWVQSPGSLMVTSASIFRVNKGKNVTPDELVAKFENSFVSLHRSSQFSDKNFFVLSGGSPVKLKREAGEGKKAVTPSDLVLDKEEFLAALRKSGLQLDTAGTKQFSLNEFKKVQELIDAAGDKKAPMTWLLLSKAISKEPAAKKEGEATAEAGLAPAVDTSVLIEWGNADVIKSAVTSLYNPSAGSEQDKLTVSEQKIYERHFDKMPLKVELFLSRGDVFNDAAKQVNDVPLDGLFLVRSKFDKGSGYLLYLTGEDRRPKDLKAAGQRLVALEAPVFNVEKGQFQVQVDAKCFLENVIYPASGKNFQLPAVDSSGQFPPESAASQLLVSDTKEGDKPRWSLKLNLNSSQVSAAPAVNTAKAKTETPPLPAASSNNSPRLEVDFADKATDSYSLRFSPGRDTTPPISDAVPVVIYDRNCKLVPLVETKTTAAVAVPKVDKPAALP
jgi:hypothetical protein